MEARTIWGEEGNQRRRTGGLRWAKGKRMHENKDIINPLFCILTNLKNNVTKSLLKR